MKTCIHVHVYIEIYPARLYTFIHTHRYVYIISETKIEAAFFPARSIFMRFKAREISTCSCVLLKEPHEQLHSSADGSEKANRLSQQMCLADS